MALELGLATPAVPRDPAALDDSFCGWAANLGVTVLGTHLGASSADLPAAVARDLRERLAGWGMRIVQATAYNPNMVQPEPRQRQIDLDRLARAMEVANHLGSPIVLGGCGSHDPRGHYAPHLENHTNAARERLIGFLQAAARLGAAAGVCLVLEPHLLTTLDTPANIHAVLAAVDSPHVRVNFDPMNLLGSVDAVFQSGAAMTNAFETVAPYWYPMAHAKDMLVENQLTLHISETFCGGGVLDFPVFMRLAGRLGARVPCLVEHMPAFLAPRALTFLRETAATAGIELVR